MLLSDAEGSYMTLPASILHLDAAAAGLNARTGRGWTERVLGLLARHGPFALAYLEALLRAADQRASRAPVADPLLDADNAPYELATSHHELAHPEPRGTASAPLAAHSAQRGTEHGLRGGASEPVDAGGGTRTPAHATRYIETRFGTLSYVELAPRLALQVSAVERAIESAEFDDKALDDALILDLHTRLCSELVPQFIGWRRVDVRIGQHVPPSFPHVPAAMREYAHDLAARLQHIDAAPDHLLELLAFAEGRLLSIHPFADFNGRSTRLLLRLLLRRLNLPAVDLVPMETETAVYLSALAAGDHANWQPLMAIWKNRLEREIDA